MLWVGALSGYSPEETCSVRANGGQTRRELRKANNDPTNPISRVLCRANVFW